MSQTEPLKLSSWVPSVSVQLSALPVPSELKTPDSSSRPLSVCVTGISMLRRLCRTSVRRLILLVASLGVPASALLFFQVQ